MSDVQSNEVPIYHKSLLREQVAAVRQGKDDPARELRVVILRFQYPVGK